MTPELYKDRLLLLTSNALAFTLRELAINIIILSEKEIEEIVRIASLIENALDDDKNPLQLDQTQKEELQHIYMDIVGNLSVIMIRKEFVEDMKDLETCRAELIQKIKNGARKTEDGGSFIL